MNMSDAESTEIKGMILYRGKQHGGKDVANWRLERPEIDYDNCVKCGLCAQYCPEEAITLDEDSNPQVDMRFCKGCGVCANECPQGAIEMAKEGR
jgi:2-oxoacid:acceptor oxidoreductase delta subunit (pyruvate/2-ketoisovalerate family)